jgi:hypothetical protein
MKTILFAALILAFSFRASADDPNQKVLTAFNKTFQHAENVSWSETPHSYEVHFKQDDITSRVTYDKEGNIIKTLRYYYENQLPIMVLTKVKQRFTDKKVYGVTEESSDAGTYYHIVLEDEKSWVDITADSYGTITVDKKFRKA